MLSVDWGDLPGIQSSSSGVDFVGLMWDWINLIFPEDTPSEDSIPIEDKANKVEKESKTEIMYYYLQSYYPNGRVINEFLYKQRKRKTYQEAQNDSVELMNYIIIDADNRKIKPDSVTIWELTKPK